MNLKQIISIFLLFCFVAIANAQPRLRPSSWAQPVLETGLSNLYQVDHELYRSEQPDHDELAQLRKLGVGEILNLREYHDDLDEMEQLSFQLHQVEMAAGSVTQEQLITALAVIKNRTKPLLVHCWHGSDRTGAVIAAYRIVFQNWTKAQALDEMVNGGFGYHASVYANLIELIESLEVAKMKAGLKISVPDVLSVPDVR